MDEDMTLATMIDLGYLEKAGADRWRLTPKGEKAFREMVASDPKFFAKTFPEWVKIDWIN